MRIHAVVTKLQIDQKRYTRELKGHTKKAMVTALRVFADAAAPHVPIDTGMARGSFLNLQSFLKRYGQKISVAIPSTIQNYASNGKPKKYYHTVGIKANKGSRVFPKGPQTSKQFFSTGPSEILSENDDGVSVNYEIRVRHFNVNEHKWAAYAYGRIAMMRYFKTAVRKDIPKVTDAVFTTELTVGRQGPAGMSSYYGRQRSRSRYRR